MINLHRINTDVKLLTIRNTHISRSTVTHNTESSGFYFHFHVQMLVASWWNLNVCCTNAFEIKCSHLITKFFWSFLSFLTFCILLLHMVCDIWWVLNQSDLYSLPQFVTCIQIWELWNDNCFDKKKNFLSLTIFWWIPLCLKFSLRANFGPLRFSIYSRSN